MYQPFKGNFSFIPKEYQVLSSFGAYYIICEKTYTTIILMPEPKSTDDVQYLWQYKLEFFYKNTHLAEHHIFIDRYRFIDKILKNKKLIYKNDIEIKYESSI